MRATAKWIMVVVALAFVAWMVFEVGMDVTGQTSGGLSGEVLRVNGIKVDLQTYYDAIRQVQDQQRLAGAPIPVTLEEQRALEDAVVEQLVQELVLSQEYRRRRIGVTDDEIREALLNIPPPEVHEIRDFQTDGVFDLAKYQAYLRSGTDPGFVLGLEQRYRQELPRFKLFEQLVEGVYLSDAELWRIYRDENEIVRPRVLVIFPAAAISDADLVLEESDIKAYYDEHRDEFERATLAYLSYVAVSRLPDAADSAAALERARAVLEEIKGGADFGEVARRESADSASRVNDGDLGEVTPGTFVEAFEKVALTLRVGELSGPVLTEFGYHIIRLESKSDDRYHARHLLIPIEPQGENLERMDTRADTLDLLAAERAEPALLDSVANRFGLPVARALPTAQGDRVQAGEYVVPDAGLWAFEAVPGETSPVVEARHAYYVFRLDSLTPGGIPPLDDIRNEVARAAQRVKRWEAARALAEQIASAIGEGIALEDAAGRHGLETRILDPFTRLDPGPVVREVPAAVGLAFGLPLGRAGGPVETDLAIIFIEPVERQAADSDAFQEQLDDMRQRLLQDARQRRIQLVMSSLRQSASVIDRRRDVERAQQELADRSATSPLGFLGR